MQFNELNGVVKGSAKRAKDFQDLMVRVAGYSDYFVNLPKGLQEEITGGLNMKEYETNQRSGHTNDKSDSL